MERFPESAQWGQNASVIAKFPIPEDVEIHRQAIEVQGVHCLASPRLEVYLLLLRRSVQLACCQNKPQRGSVLHQFANVKQESRLRLDHAHWGPPLSALMTSSLDLLEEVLPK